MKHNETQICYALIGVLGITLLTFLILALPTASATTEQNTPLTINETQITTSGTAYGPAIYGTRIVWTDSRNGNRDIYMYDLSTNKETQITTNESNQYLPAIYGDRIVYMDDRKSDENPLNHDEIPENDQPIIDIYMYDLSTNKETQITTNESIEANPSIYGNRIIWVDNRNETSDIYMYDLSTNKETQITTNKSYEGSPAIYGNRIVWEDNRNTNYDIYMYDLSTNKETQITTNGSDQVRPDIYGDRIVWMDIRNLIHGYDIYMYDLSTSKETKITTNGPEHLNPAIYGNRIVWGNYSYNPLKLEIYMYDLSTNKETPITANGLYNDNADIYGNRIVWDNQRDGNIYMCTVSGEESEPVLPVASFSSNVTQGYAPLSVQFTDLSINSTSRNWDFENDGTIDSTEETPIHVYATPGNYTANLTAINENGTDSKTATINVLKAIPTITWGNPADITYGTGIDGTQLNAVATDPVSGATLAGTFTYTPVAGTVMSAGTQTLKVDFIPTDTTNYNAASKDVTINVLKATPTVTWNNPADISYKTALSDVQLNAIASVPGTFTYTPPSGTVLSAGTQTLKVNFTPTDTVNYNSVSQTVRINVLSKNSNGNTNGNNGNGHNPRK